MEEEEEYQPGTEQIIPIEVHTLMFYGKPLVAVRLPDGRPAVSISSLCKNMQLDRKAQVKRIQRTAPIAPDLIPNVVIDLQTGGGPQPSQVLVLRSLTYWLTGIDHKRTRPEMREEILIYQCEAVDALYTWAGQRPQVVLETELPLMIAAPSDPSTAIAEQPGADGVVLAPMMEPREGASAHERTTYHEVMSIWHRHQADLHAQAWREELEARIEDQETRIEGREAVVNLIPEIIERLGPAKITPTQQGQVRVYVKRLHELTGKAYPTIYENISLAFGPARYQDLLEADWAKIEQWFQVQIERGQR